jgi:hypothetical protein
MAPIRFRSAFFAYPGGPPDLAGPIAAVSKLIDADRLKLMLWPEMPIFGVHIPEEVRNHITDADVLVCDITIPNLNVYYEIGFAIGLGKAIAPTVNRSFAGAEADIQEDGLFDTIGYRPYENSNELATILGSLPTANLVDLYAKPVNTQQPLYVLDTFRKTDFRNAVISAIKENKVFFRSFDPVEDPRFSSVAAITELTASVGAVIPILAPHVHDAPRHNLRAAFLAGLSHGLDRPALLIQQEFQTGNPADFRDMVVTARSQSEVAEQVGTFATQSMIGIQSLGRLTKTFSRSALQQLTLGASSAENEFRTLENYFYETSEFLRTLRGEISIVSGRKGSGKTAIFFMTRNALRRDKRNLITDLKPESHQLSLFRQELLKIVDAGVFDHTVAAFWYFLICSETLLTVKKEIDHQLKRDSAFLNAAIEIEETFERFGINERGDFTSRINNLSNFVLQEIERARKLNETLSPERLTNIIFRNAIIPIKALILKNTKSNTILVFLFDNIDKGWPANGVDRFDIRSVRLMIEALDRVKRDLLAGDRKFLPVVFLRNDIYELMVEETSDRGKEAQVRIDWTDRTKLRQVIYNRLLASEQGQHPFEKLWHKYFTPTVRNRPSFDYFIDHCLMRPRFLINIIDNAVANGINRGHELVGEDDCIDAVRQHSHYLVKDFGFEIRDASGISAQLLYALRGTTELVTQSEIIDRFKSRNIPEKEIPQAFQLLLWYGVLGIATNTGAERYIYDYDYDKALLDADLAQEKDEVLFIVNPALHVGLTRQ